MELSLNSIFNLSNKEINNSKIELNMRSGSQGISYLNKWLKYSDDDKRNGLCRDCSYWAWYGDKNNFKENNLVFSFIRLTPDEWLFISAGTVINVPDRQEKDGRATVEILPRFQPLFGRLIIKYNKGNTFARYVFKLGSILEKAKVKEILPVIYSGDQFEGYDHVHFQYDELKDIFDNNIKPTYYEALKKVSGVYCLTDTNTGKLYIGSATGEDGVAQRWRNYLASTHGGNKELKKLHNDKGEDYFKKYFTFTLLEYFNLSYDPNKVIEREQYWKKCLDTIKHGYNDN